MHTVFQTNLMKDFFEDLILAVPVTLNKKFDFFTSLSDHSYYLWKKLGNSYKYLDIKMYIVPIVMQFAAISDYERILHLQLDSAPKM